MGGSRARAIKRWANCKKQHRVEGWLQFCRVHRISRSWKPGDMILISFSVGPVLAALILCYGRRKQTHKA